MIFGLCTIHFFVFYFWYLPIENINCRELFLSNFWLYKNILQFQEVSTDSISDASKRKLAPDSTVPRQQSSFSCSNAQRQPANWYPLKKKVKVPQPPSQILQCPRQNAVPAFWCKICKVDCVTEFNFGAHIGGKKHKAKKLEILGNRNIGRPGSQSSGNRHPVQNSNAVSGSRNSGPNVSCSIVSASCDLSSESRINGTEESGCTAPPMRSLDFTASWCQQFAPCTMSSEK